MTKSSLVSQLVSQKENCTTLRKEKKNWSDDRIMFVHGVDKKPIVSIQNSNKCSVSVWKGPQAGQSPAVISAGSLGRIHITLFLLQSLCSHGYSSADWSERSKPRSQSCDCRLEIFMSESLSLWAHVCPQGWLGMYEVCVWDSHCF